MNIKICRYHINDSEHMILNIEGKIFESYFCENCGNYLKTENKTILCNCDKIRQTYERYRSFIVEIPDITSGDELEDYIEYPHCGNHDFVKYIYNMVLFGITYEKPYYYVIDDDVIEKILNYVI